MSSRNVAVSISLLLASSLFIPIFMLHPVRGTIPVIGSATCIPTADFLLDTSPSNFVMIPGTTASSTITVTPKNGFSGAVSLAAVNVPSDIVNPQFSATTLEILPGGVGGSSTLTFGISVSSTGTFSFEVNATTNGALYHTEIITVKVATHEIGISADTFGLTIPRGNQGTSTITVASFYGFSGTVSLTATITPLLFTAPSPPTATVLPSPVSLSPAGQTVSTLTVSTSSSTTLGAYSINVTGTDGISISNSTFIYLQVTGPDFSIGAKPYALTVLIGGSGTASIELNSTIGFTGTVDLSVDITPSFPAIFNAPVGTLNANSVVLAAGEKTTDALAIDASAATPGYYFANITGTSGPLSHWTLLSISVANPQPGFSITPAPASLSLLQGGTSSTSLLTVQSTNNFAGDVNLSIICYPDEISASLDTGTVTVTSGGTAPATLTVSAPQTATPGLYFVSIIGEGVTTSATNETSVEVNVIGADFTLHADPSSLTIVQGTSGTSTISYTGSSGFAATVHLDATVIGSAGIHTSLSSLSITPGTISTLTVTVDNTVSPGVYYGGIIGTSGSLTHALPMIVTVTAPAPDFSIVAPPIETVVAGTPTIATIAVSPNGAFTSDVSLSASVIPLTGLSVTLDQATVPGGSGTSILTLSGTVSGAYTVTITGVGGGYTRQATIAVVVSPAPDFTISTSPSTVTFAPGASGASTISFFETGFYADISVSATSSSNNLQVDLSPTVSSYGITPITATFNSSTPGTYTVVITGTSSGLTRTATITVIVTETPDFAVSASPTGVTTIAGTAGGSTITIESVNGFTGSVALTSTISPSPGLTCTLSPSSVTLGNSRTSALSCNGSAGTYTVTVTGTSGSLHHSQDVQFTINPSSVSTPDFTVTSSVSSMTIAAGKSNAVTITVTATNGYYANVGLTTSVYPAGPVASINPASFLYGTGSSVLTINVGADVSPGTYTVTVTGSGSGLSHSATITLTVMSPEQSSNSSNNNQLILGLEPGMFYILAGVIVAALIAAVGVALRSRKPKP